MTQVSCVEPGTELSFDIVATIDEGSKNGNCWTLRMHISVFNVIISWFVLHNLWNLKLSICQNVD